MKLYGNPISTEDRERCYQLNPAEMDALMKMASHKEGCRCGTCRGLNENERFAIRNIRAAYDKASLNPTPYQTENPLR